ncbi:MAG: hypothetical protein JST59_02195, partial [Actinobacteria bacterium]|nr:hypothetical protein [Actinomycetota bacterium]
MLTEFGTEFVRRWKLVFTQERLRVLLKGKMYIIAFVFNIVLFWAYRELAVMYWPEWITKYANYRWHIFLFGTQAISWTTHILNFAFWDGIDYFRLFYRYKVNKVRNSLLSTTSYGM